MKKGSTSFSAKFNAYFKDFGMDFWVSLAVSLLILALAFVFLNNYEQLHPVTKVLHNLFSKIVDYALFRRMIVRALTSPMAWVLS